MKEMTDGKKLPALPFTCTGRDFVLDQMLAWTFRPPGLDETDYKEVMDLLVWGRYRSHWMEEEDEEGDKKICAGS